MTSFLDRVNQQFFDGGLSADVLQLLEPVENERPEVRAFVERMCRQMRRQNFDARDFSAFLAWIVGAFVAKLLPGAWGGSVPPITLAGRHARIDDYIEANPWGPLKPNGRFLDLGCGFPPVTTVDSANRFPAAEILGVDPSFGRYLVRGANDDYACFNDESELLYFQPGTNEIDRWDALYDDPEATRAKFLARLEQLRPSLPADDGTLARAERDGVILTRSPVLEFAQSNLRFDQRGIGSDGLGTFDVVRCFNVLVYFDRAFRQRALEWLDRVLVEGGIFLSGMDWAKSRHARYAVYRREGGRIVAKEFAISIENVRPLEIVGFFALHDDDYDTAAMASIVSTLRSNHEFRRDFDGRMDELLAEVEFCARDEDGYLGTVPEGADPQTLERAANSIGRTLEQEGFAHRAVDILRTNGHEAWVNCVGHVAVDPARLSV